MINLGCRLNEWRISKEIVVKIFVMLVKIFDIFRDFQTLKSPKRHCLYFSIHSRPPGKTFVHFKNIIEVNFLTKIIESLLTKLHSHFSSRFILPNSPYPIQYHPTVPSGSSVDLEFKWVSFEPVSMFHPPPVCNRGCTQLTVPNSPFSIHRWT